VVDKRRVDDSRVRLAEVSCGDETGIVSLRARDDQIDVVQAVAQKEGAIVLRNCTIELYQGKHIRIAVTKWGKLSTYPDQVASTPPPPSKMNQDRNFSLIDLSVVANEISTFSQVPMHSMNENQHLLQQTISYHRQHPDSQQQQHKYVGKHRNKQSN
jgi:replication factor A1